MVGWLVGFKASWLVGWLVGFKASWLVGWFYVKSALVSYLIPNPVSRYICYIWFRSKLIWQCGENIEKQVSQFEIQWVVPSQVWLLSATQCQGSLVSDFTCVKTLSLVDMTQYPVT